MLADTIETLAELAEAYAGPLAAWLLQVVLWACAGMNPLTVLGTIAALWWTIERARTERAKRRAVEKGAYVSTWSGLDRP